MRSERPVTEVPDVVGFGAEDACAIVRAAGLVPSGPDFTAAPTAGVIIAQRPIGAAGAEEGTTVFLWTQRGGSKEEGAVPPPFVESGELDRV
ncbi:MAG: PASTA domain-containing protein [Haloechinothrix sp.]